MSGGLVEQTQVIQPEGLHVSYKAESNWPIIY